MTARLSQVSRAFALLIGVNDYTEYDESAPATPGQNSLPGSLSDVAAFYRMCRQLHIRRDNIHVLTGPKVTPEGLAERGRNKELAAGICPGLLEEASRANILAQLEWLADKLARSPGDPQPPPMGLLFYSGHGDYKGGALALCPSDVIKGADGDPEGAITFSEVQSILNKRPGASENLTVILDCCHAGAADTKPAEAPGARTKRRSITGREAPSADIPSIGQRMILAAKPNELAWQSTFDETDHGALTWAFHTVLDQWTKTSDGDNIYATITHGELRDRAQKLLDALAFNQDIVLCPKGAEGDSFFHRGKGGVFSSSPDKPRHGIQIDPTWISWAWKQEYPNIDPDYTLYTLKAGQTTLGAVLVVRNARGGYIARTEYWNVPANLDASRITRITAANGRWPTSGALISGFPATTSAPTYTMQAAVSWTTESTQPTAAVWTPDEGTGVLGLSITAGTTSSAPQWTWAQGSVAATPSAYVVAGDVPSLETTEPTNSYTWSTWSATATIPTFVSATAPPKVITVGALSAFSAANVSDTVYVACTRTTSLTTIQLYQSSDGATWTSSSVTSLTGAQPYVFAYGTALSVCYSIAVTVENVTTYTIKWAQWSATTSTWTHTTVASGLSVQPAFAAVYEPGSATAYFVYTDAGGIKKKHFANGTMSAAGAVTLPAAVSLDSRPSVSLTVFKSKPYLSLVSGEKLWVGDLTSFGTAKSALSAPPGNDGAISADSSGAELIAVVDPDSSMTYSSSSDGSTWASSQGLGAPVTSGLSTDGASLVAWNGQLLAFFSGTSGTSTDLYCVYGVG